MIMPCEKLRSLSRPSQYFKSGLTVKMLDAFMAKMTDNKAAEQVKAAPSHLFKQLHERLKIWA